MARNGQGAGAIARPRTAATEIEGAIGSEMAPLQNRAAGQGGSLEGLQIRRAASVGEGLQMRCCSAAGEMMGESIQDSRASRARRWTRRLAVCDGDGQ